MPSENDVVIEEFQRGRDNSIIVVATPTVDNAVVHVAHSNEDRHSVDSETGSVDCDYNGMPPHCVRALKTAKLISAILIGAAGSALAFSNYPKSDGESSDSGEYFRGAGYCFMLIAALVFIASSSDIAAFYRWSKARFWERPAQPTDLSANPNTRARDGHGDEESLLAGASANP